MINLYNNIQIRKNTIINSTAWDSYYQFISESESFYQFIWDPSHITRISYNYEFRLDEITVIWRGSHTKIVCLGSHMKDVYPQIPSYHLPEHSHIINTIILYDYTYHHITMDIINTIISYNYTHIAHTITSHNYEFRLVLYPQDYPIIY